jgi:hypothetical protein
MRVDGRGCGVFGVPCAGNTRAIGSGTLIPEILGPIILPSRPLVVVVCELAEEGCRPVPAVGGTLGPCPELLGEVPLLDATAGLADLHVWSGCYLHNQTNTAASENASAPQNCRAPSGIRPFK